MNLPITSIRRDSQGPEYLIEEKFWEITAAILHGDAIEPIVLRFDGENYWLQDGFHRVAAAMSLGHQEIEASTLPGTLADVQATHEANRGKTLIKTVLKGDSLVATQLAT